MTTRARAPWWVLPALTLGLLLSIGPFVWMLLGAFKTNADLTRVTPTLLPERWTLDNFVRLFAEENVRCATSSTARASRSW